MLNNSKGFTLIELLVVISIVSLLSSTILTTTNSARMKARDARRIADLTQIRNALELFYSSNGYYPPIPISNSVDCTTVGTGWDCNGYIYSTNWQSLATDLAPYLRTMPADPINSAGCDAPWILNCYTYAYGNVGRNGSAIANPNKVIQYDLTAQLEDTTHARRCGVVGYRFFFDNRQWCGVYPNQIYEASIQ